MSDASDQEEAEETRLSSIDYHTLNPSAAWLAADENAYLRPIHDTDDNCKRFELAEWIGGVLGEYLNPETLFDDLCSGVRLLYLAKSIQLIKCANLKNSEYANVIRNLQPDEFAFTHGEPLKRASLIAKQRSNIAKFLEWCRVMGVPLVTLFETEDLAHEKNLRQVTSCLFYVSRIASRFGIEPPSSVKDELKNEETKLLKSNMKLSGTSSPKVKMKRLVLGKAPTIKHEKETHPAVPSNETHVSNLDSENRERIFKPPSTQNFDEISDSQSEIKPISPMELRFEDVEGDDVAVETRRESPCFDKKTFKDKDIREPEDRFIAKEFQFRPVDFGVDHEIVELKDGNEVRKSPTVYGLEDNAFAAFSDSTFDTETTDEDEYHTAQSTIPHDMSGLAYHTAQVHGDSDSKEESENMSAQSVVDERMQGQVAGSESTDSPSEEMRDVDDDMVASPYIPFRVPADMIVEQEKTESSADESATDVGSYASSDVEREITFTSIGVGTEDQYFEVDKKKDAEIMINFPPYFEFTTKNEFPQIPPQVHTVAPVQNEPIYAVSSKRKSTQSQSHTNPAYEAEQESVSSHSRDYSSLEPRQPRRQRQHRSSPATLPLPHTRRVFEQDAQNVKGTQTHVSLTQDIVRIINELEDIPTVRTTHSSVSSGTATTPTGSGAGTTVVIRTQYQRTLLTSDRDVAITQFSDLEGERPPRWGSVNSSTRHRIREPEHVSSPNKAVRRSIIRRASSLISEQFEKAAVAAKKYKKQISIVLVLLILTAGALAAMLAVFPLT